MKKYVFIMLIALFSILSLNDAKAQLCDPGWSNATITIGPDANNCYYTVQFCYKCGITGIDPGKIKIKRLLPLSGNCFLPDFNWLNEQLRVEYYNLCSQIPPCGVNCLTIIVETPACYRWKVLGTRDENNKYHYNKWLEGCDIANGYVLTTWKMCFNTQTGLYEQCYVEFPCQNINITCQENPVTEPNVPEDFGGDFTGYQYWGPCFQYYTCP